VTDQETAVEAALARLSLAQKVRLLTGADFWALPPEPQIGLDRLLMSDGPIGVRGEEWSSADPSLALPSPTALAATWDTSLIRRVGLVLAQEARRKGVHVLLAPTVNLHRSPLGGRHFECFSEDPFLTGEAGAAYVAGVQEGGVAATVKHFVANDSETDRLTVSAVVGERALRELYLAPFERIVGAGVWAVMAAYNAVNGTTMTEHAELLTGVLKGEWGFDGAVMSDWTAARSTEAAALAGLDIVMPGPSGPWGAALEVAVREGKVPAQALDDKVRRVLRLAARTGALAGAAPAITQLPADIAGAALAREAAARSFVLLRNEPAPGNAAPGSAPVLPLNGTERIALIGPGAATARAMGGGSARVFPSHVVSPINGLLSALPPGAEVTCTAGTDPRTRLAPAGGEGWADPRTGAAGLRAVLADASGGVVTEALLRDGQARWLGRLPGRADPARVTSAEISAVYTPQVSGMHEFGIEGLGPFTLRVDGATVFDEDILPPGDDQFAGFLRPPERRVAVQLTGGRPVGVTLTCRAAVARELPAVAFRLGHAAPSPGPEEMLAAAARAAARADVAIVVVGTTEEVESEGFDRTGLALPGRQDELVARVAAANPRTVVVVNAGSPVLMPWAGDVGAVLLAWFPGQEYGNALADVLLGRAEPGGRLPTTWPGRAEDCPVLSTTPSGGELRYDEGVFIGYRAWEAASREPAYWFGHGLGYTTWAYEDLEVTGERLTVRVRNTGQRPGREVVQAYAGPDARDPDRPVRWLAGFAAVDADPGELAEVTITLPSRAFQVWTDSGWQTVRGRYRIAAGRSIADRRLSAVIDI
jgi:beta-glucosidase